MEIAATNRFIHTHTDEKSKNLGLKAYKKHDLLVVFLIVIFASVYVCIERSNKVGFRTCGSTVEEITNVIGNESQLNKGQFNSPLF